MPFPFEWSSFVSTRTKNNKRSYGDKQHKKFIIILHPQTHTTTHKHTSPGTHIWYPCEFIFPVIYIVIFQIYVTIKSNLPDLYSVFHKNFGCFICFLSTLLRFMCVHSLHGNMKLIMMDGGPNEWYFTFFKRFCPLNEIIDHPKDRPNWKLWHDNC